MDNSLSALCDAIKKICSQLKPQSNQLSFLVLTGKAEQGKSALLKQSGMEELPVLSEQHAKLYFNQQGIVVELGEAWFTNSRTLMQNTLRQLNRCSRHIKITGFILCMDVNTLLISDPEQFNEQRKAHLHFLERLGTNLGYPVELALVLTKMDTLAGFTDFYQMDHATELSKALGFSLDCLNQPRKKAETFSKQFNQLTESLTQQVISKMHPVRSTIKRCLIREMPLQFTSLYQPLQAVIRGISPQLFHLHSVYFTSAEQGGVSIDRLNKKIRHEYALVVQDTFPQAANYRAYFVEGAFKNILAQCAQAPQPRQLPQKQVLAIAAGITVCSLLILGYNHYKASHVLDDVSKELLTYDALSQQGGNNAQALYHLSKANSSLGHIVSNSVSLPTVNQLKANLHNKTQNRLEGEFIPSLTSEIEAVITNPANTPIVRYKALKTYLMLAQPEHFSAKAIAAWFAQSWQQQPPEVLNKRLALLNDALAKPLQPLAIKQQIISDARNYLNALPSSYLYYSIAKELFPTGKQKIAVEGFTLATDEIPAYYTKPGFTVVIENIPAIAETLQAENWVLARQDLGQLKELLIQAYCFDYATWWQTFIKKSQPMHYQDYQQGRQLALALQRSSAIAQLTALIQQETKPDLTDSSSYFNQYVAHKFTDINLMSASSAQELTLKLSELDRFLATLAVVSDGGKTAFTISKARFTNDYASDPVSALFMQAKQVPDPLGSWAKQIAGDAWIILIRDSRQYINQQWQQTVYQEFQNAIARRYPFDSNQHDDIQLQAFNHFFAPHGTLNTFSENFIKPFLDLSSAEWKPKAVNDFVMPLSTEALDQMIRANIITTMFFPDHGEQCKIDFSLQKITLDPVVANLTLELGATKLNDNQGSESFMQFVWPQNNARLALNAIDGNHYELAEQGPWALFKLLEKVNVLVDEQDSSSLQILFEINSNSGRYLLKSTNQVNPFTPGILNGFTLNEAIV